jgi:hypothetical protein
MTSCPKARRLSGNAPDVSAVEASYVTNRGEMHCNRIEVALQTDRFAEIKGTVNLIVTSPPFPLVHKKRYGNETGDAYLTWLEKLAPPLADLLAEDGSIDVFAGIRSSFGYGDGALEQAKANAG